MKLFKYGMEKIFQTSLHLPSFNVDFILSAVSKAAFDQTHKVMKKKRKKINQRSIQINRVKKKLQPD